MGTPERAAHEKEYLKSELKHIGVRVPDVRKVVAAEWRELEDLDREQTLELAEALWSDAVYERRLCAVELLVLGAPMFTAGDLFTIEPYLRRAKTWALVDNLAEGVVGQILLQDSAAGEVLDHWSTDDDFWLRRTALLALLAGVRSGQPDLERFSRYADPMLKEKEFFIRKAIGWVLRELVATDPDYVVAWVRPRAHQMSGVTFKEATRKLPQEVQAELSAAR